MIDITRDMVETLQDLLAQHGYAATVQFKDDQFPKGIVVLVDERGVDSYTLNMVDEFYNTISDYFLSIGIEIKFNNTQRTFWSISKQ